MSHDANRIIGLYRWPSDRGMDGMPRTLDDRDGG
jgi:hypothetical protein